MPKRKAYANCLNHIWVSKAAQWIVVPDVTINREECANCGQTKTIRKEIIRDSSDPLYSTEARILYVKTLSADAIANQLGKYIEDKSNPLNNSVYISK